MERASSPSWLSHDEPPETVIDLTDEVVRDVPAVPQRPDVDPVPVVVLLGITMLTAVPLVAPGIVSGPFGRVSVVTGVVWLLLAGVAAVVMSFARQLRGAGVVRGGAALATAAVGIAVLATVAHAVRGVVALVGAFG